MTRDGRDDDGQTRGPASPRVPKYGATYESLERWVSHWYQIGEIQRDKPESVLEIGIGSGIVAEHLRHLGHTVVTLDLDPTLEPDVVGSITEMPFSVGSFDVVSAFEVLEHLTKAQVPQALAEMKRVARSGVLISVPDTTRAYALQLPIPRLGVRRWLFERGTVPAYALHSGHRWEIGHGNVSTATVRTWLHDAGLSVERDYRPFEHPYHHFFICTVQ